MKFKSDIEVQAGLRDGGNDIGTAGQILSSTGSQTNWIDQDSIVASEAKLVVIECKNTSGSTISKGTPVYQTGTVGATDVIEIDVADASDEDKMAAIGLLQSDLANNAFGKVVITGELLNIITSPIDGVTPVTGDTIYVKSGGGLTLTKPTGVNFIQNIGLVGKVSGGNSGSITVSSIMRSNDVPTPLYIDHDNQILGIGTTSPSVYHKLDVNGSANFSTDIVVGRNATALSFDMNPAYDSGNYYLNLHKNQSNDGGVLLYSKPTSGSAQLDWQIVNQGTTGDLKFYAAGLAGNALVLDRETGNLQLPEYGAGTLVSDASGNITVSSGGGAGGPYLPLSAGTSFPLTGDLYQTMGAIGVAQTDQDYIAKIYELNSDGFMSLYTGQPTPLERIRISSYGDSFFVPANNGNVGIGTTSPTAAKLVVSSNTGPQLLIKSPSTGSSAAQILFEHNSGGTQNASITFDQSSQNTLTIATGYQSPSDLNRINISPAGNVGLTVRGGTGGSGLGQPLVGIGTTSPTEKLDVAGNIKIQSALLSNQNNTDVDTGTEAIASVVLATYTAAFFDFVIKKGTNVRSGTVYACHNGDTTPLVEFTETSTNDLGDTSDVTLSVDISGANMRLLATVTSDDWSVKSLIRAI